MLQYEEPETNGHKLTRARKMHDLGNRKLRMSCNNASVEKLSW